ncbi:hypothetical protein ACFLXO_04535 [Chloroflexota bacterium]
MNLLNLRKRKKKQKKNIFDDEASGKTQFNVVINVEIKEAIDQMAKQFRLNKSVTTEHLLQVGLYYNAIAIKDEEKKKRLEKHLINAHLLNKYTGDEKAMLLIGEENDSNWLLLEQSQLFVSRMKRFTKAMDYALGIDNPGLYK